MTSQSTASTLQVCRNCGGGAPVDVHFCPQCTKILTLGRHGDYFAFLGLPRKLNLDAADLEQRFRALSRQFHPDFFYNAHAGRAARQPRAVVVPERRVPHAARPGRAAASTCCSSKGWRRRARQRRREQVPPALLEEVFALNEELDEIRELRAGGAPADDWQARLERARGSRSRRKRAEHEAQLRGAVGALGRARRRRRADAERRDVLEALRERLLERNYINNLLAGIERELRAVAAGQSLQPWS